MPMRSGLAIYLYTAPTSSLYSQLVLEIGSQVTNLSFGSNAPGGFTTFSALLPLRDARIPLPPLTLFSKIAVMSSMTPVWLGEVTDPEQGMDDTYGEYVRISGLGLGNALRDDPEVTTYVNQTAQTIIRNQLSFRTNGSPLKLFETIATDNSQIFPDNPATLFSPSYDNRTFEEVIADVCTLAGDYQWGVWAHPVQKDGAGYPLGQLVVHQRDTSTTHYSASIIERDVVRYTLTPSAERAYNYITVDYTTATGGVGTKVSADPRLDPSSYAQNQAPFRFRQLARDYTGTSTITATQAQALADTYRTQYQNVSNKVTFVLRRVHDANGNLIPLWDVLADHNIFIRDFAPRGVAPLPKTPTASVNQFYIVSAMYREDQSGTSQLELQCDNFVDQVQSQIARLTLAADVKARTSKTKGVMQAKGAPANGYVAIGQSNAVAGQNCTSTIQFPAALYQAPTSIAFTQLANVNLGAPSAHSITPLGAYVSASTVANGVTQGAWTYTTSGNCIRRVGRKLFDWHCDGCGKELKGLALARHVRVETALGTAPGLVALAIDCPECGAGEQPFTESFNTALTAVDEDVTRGKGHGYHPFRAEQARLIRALMRSGPVGLDTLL